MAQKVAVVTGSNKGIGFAIVKGLCEKFQGLVYLTARDVSRGEAAVAELKKQGLNPNFHQLDITDQNSIDSFRNYLKANYGGIDLLVNNAAIAFKSAALEPFAQQAKETNEINYFATLRLCEALFPLLRQNARVVNVSSSAGHLLRIPSAELRSKLSNQALTVPELNSLVNEFIEDAKKDQHLNTWGNSAYVVSKVALSALTRIHQRIFNEENPNRNISVNSVHPGYVDTDMTSHQGVLTIEEGAVGPLWLALDASQNVKGEYVWKDTTIVDWVSGRTPSAV